SRCRADHPSAIVGRDRGRFASDARCARFSRSRRTPPESRRCRGSQRRSRVRCARGARKERHPRRRTRLTVRVRVAVTVAPLLLVLAWPAGASANPQQAGIQVALRALGLYCGPIDGIVGPQTVTAVRVVQRRAHLPATGVIDARTRVAMGPLGTPLFGSRTLRPGQFGLDVAVLQYLLAKRGLYGGALDGYLGKRTAIALRRYQRRTRLLADGVVGPRTRAALVLATGVPVRAIPVALRTYVVRPGDN